MISPGKTVGSGCRTTGPGRHHRRAHGVPVWTVISGESRSFAGTPRVCWPGAGQVREQAAGRPGRPRCFPNPPSQRTSPRQPSGLRRKGFLAARGERSERPVAGTATAAHTQPPEADLPSRTPTELDTAIESSSHTLSSGRNALGRWGPSNLRTMVYDRRLPTCRRRARPPAGHSRGLGLVASR
jgi:hypothetical protein